MQQETRFMKRAKKILNEEQKELYDFFLSKSKATATKYLKRKLQDPGAPQETKKQEGLKFDRFKKETPLNFKHHGGKTPLKSGRRRGENRPLSPVEREVLNLLTNEFLTPNQIAIRRGTTVQAVHQVLKRLHEKSWIDSNGNRGLKNTPPVSMEGFKDHTIITKKWRYHALHFVIKPYYFEPRFHKIRKEKGNYGINYGDWIIKLHPDMVEMQLQAGEDFADPDKWAATSKAEASFNRTLRQLMSRFGFYVWKNGKANIRLVNQHLARNPSEVANARDGDYLSVRGYDNVVYFTIDKSKGAEHEYKHAERALTDSEVIEPHFNDWLYNKPPTASETWHTVSQVAAQVKELAAGLNAIVAITKAQMQPPKSISEEGERPEYIN